MVALCYTVTIARLDSDRSKELLEFEPGTSRVLSAQREEVRAEASLFFCGKAKLLIRKVSLGTCVAMALLGGDGGYSGLSSEEKA